MAALQPQPQPGALDLYPPTLTGRFAVPLDHYRFAPQPSFTLRYAAFESFASRSNAPVLLYCGNEAPLELFYNASGALFEHAEALGARVLFIEHRYYGTSLPFMPANQSFTNEGLQWLTVEQALADYATFIVALPSLLGCSGKKDWRCDVILFGGSYGGMLAAWHRFKYPHLSLGAVASGAPIDFYPGGPESVQAAFRQAVIDTFEQYGDEQNGNGGCGEALRAALLALNSASNKELAAAGVKPCAPWRADSVERYAFYAKGALADIALVDYPYPTDFIAPLPANPVRAACKRLTTHASSGRMENNTLLEALHAAVLLLVNASGTLECLDLRAELVGQPELYDSVVERPLTYPVRPWLRVASFTQRGLRAQFGESQSRHTSHSAAERASLNRNTSSNLGASSNRGASSGVLPSFGAMFDVDTSSNLGVKAWNYQACTALLLEPITSDGYGFYPPSTSQINQTIAICTQTFGYILLRALTSPNTYAHFHLQPQPQP